jgi:hypothetical protein
MQVSQTDATVSAATERVCVVRARYLLHACYLKAKISKELKGQAGTSCVAPAS